MKNKNNFEQLANYQCAIGDETMNTNSKHEYATCKFNDIEQLVNDLKSQPTMFHAISLANEINILNGCKIINEYHISKIKKHYKEKHIEESKKRYNENKYREMQKAYMKLLSK